MKGYELWAILRPYSAINREAEEQNQGSAGKIHASSQSRTAVLLGPSDRSIGGIVEQWNKLIRQSVCNTGALDSLFLSLLRVKIGCLNVKVLTIPKLLLDQCAILSLTKN